MGLFDKKSSIMRTALGVSGALNKEKKTNKAAAFGAALGASIGSGQKWTMADSIRLGATINALDSLKEDSVSDYSGYSGNGCSNSGNEYDDLILTSSQEEELERAGIDSFEFRMMMDDDEKIEALEEAGLDPFDFDMY